LVGTESLETCYLIFSRIEALGIMGSGIFAYLWDVALRFVITVAFGVLKKVYVEAFVGIGIWEAYLLSGSI